MYNNVRACVKTSNGLTDFFSSTSGVKHGCNLSPNLFNIFVNDITNISNLSCEPVSLGGSKVNCLLYADNLLVMSNSKHGLQQCLNKLNDYTKKWKLQVNLKKTILMIFNKSGRKLNCLKASCSFWVEDSGHGYMLYVLGFCSNTVWFFLSKPRPVVQQRLAYYVYSFKRFPPTEWNPSTYIP